MPEQPFAVLKHAQKVFVLVPKVKPFPIEQIVLKVTQIVFIFWKYFKSEPISSPMFKWAKIEISLNVDPVRI